MGDIFMAGGRKGRGPGFMHRVEKSIIKLAVAGIVILVVFQAIMLNDTVRVFLNYATRLEGGPLEDSAMLSSGGRVVLRLENDNTFPQAFILVNGEPVKALNDYEIELEVRNNDLIEIDATNVGDEYVYLTTVGVSDNVLQPSIGQRAKARKRIELFSRIRLK
jgi:hypothetical protein